MSITCQENFRLSPQGDAAPECLPTGSWTQHQVDQWYWTADPLRWARSSRPLPRTLFAGPEKILKLFVAVWLLKHINPALGGNQKAFQGPKPLQFPEPKNSNPPPSPTWAEGGQGRNQRSPGAKPPRKKTSYPGSKTSKPSYPGILRNPNPDTGGTGTREPPAGTGSRDASASP